VLERKGKKWIHVLAYEFALKIPAPAQLYARIKAVFNFFANTVDQESKKPVFNAVAKRKAHVILKMVSDGFCQIHLALTSTPGKPMEKERR
jgi:hypothetical protein